MSAAHRILTAAALRSGASPVALAVPPAPVTPPAPVAAGTEQPIDVVTVADAQAAIATASAEGAASERARTAAVLASASAKANPETAAFMLNMNPTATAEQLIQHLDTMPKPAASAAPAPAPTPPAPAASATPAPLITTPLSETPPIVVAPNANAGGAEAMSVEDQHKSWDQHITAATASLSSPFGGELAPGLPRTGN